MSHECIVMSILEGIFTDTTTSISTTMVHTPISTDSEVDMCSDLPVNSNEPNLVALTTGDALSARTAYDKFDVINVYIITKKSETFNLTR